MLKDKLLLRCLCNNHSNKILCRLQPSTKYSIVVYLFVTLQLEVVFWMYPLFQLLENYFSGCPKDYCCLAIRPPLGLLYTWDDLEHISPQAGLVMSCVHLSLLATDTKEKKYYCSVATPATDLCCMFLNLEFLIFVIYFISIKYSFWFAGKCLL